LGGLSKKAFQYEKIISQEKIPALMVDAGSLLFKHSTLSLKLAEQEKVTAFSIVESYNQMGYHAVGIAREDLIAGLDFLKKIKAASAFPWLSANLVEANTKRPLFSPSVLLRKGDLTIGITCLTSSNVYSKFDKEENAEILPWQEVLPDLVHGLKDKADLVILLSNLPEKDNLAITEAYPEIAIILQAGVNSANQPPKLFNQTLVGQAGKQGKQIGVMNINWQNAPWGSNMADQLDKDIKSLDRLNWQLAKFDKYKEPLVELQAEPDKLAIYQNLLSNQKTLEKQIAKLSAETSQMTPERVPSTYKNKFIAMQTSLPDQKEVVAIIDKLNAEINRIGQKQINRKDTKESEYIGSECCAGCNEYQGTSWQKSKHARAYETLANKNQQFNLNCLPCHVTGSGDLDKGEAVNLPENLQGVGCENCHGPGRRHAKSPEQFRLSTQVAAATCLKCHTDDHDDSFEFAADVRKLRCVE
jgi:2',3'-cyclic-nucleotide 2'-phosphodiesterase (5'-nucleotidase family)